MTMPGGLTLKNRTVTSPESGATYKLRNLVGKGAFGQVWSCEASGRVGSVCIKITDDQESWHREAYMATLVGHRPNIVKVFETFPILGRRGVFYAVVMEFAERGTVADEVKRAGAWSEKRVVAALRDLLGAIDLLHRGGAIHRDITPYNVFAFGAAPTLKLGDFGIATHGPQRGVAANAFNPWFVDTRIRLEKRLRWDVRDDLWQLAQIAAVLLTGTVEPLRPQAVRWLRCSDTLKMVIARATGDRWSSFLSADDMAAALGKSAPWRMSRPNSLAGRNVVFTGLLGLPRKAATKLAQRAGARVSRDFSSQTDTIVVGSSDQWAAGDAGGRKLLAAAAEKERGRKIDLISGEWFCHLVGLRFR